MHVEARRWRVSVRRRAVEFDALQPDRRSIIIYHVLVQFFG